MSPDELLAKLGALDDERIRTKEEAIPEPRRAEQGEPRRSRSMSPDEFLATLDALGNEQIRARNAKNGAGDNQFGVKLGDIRALAKSIKTDHALGLALWETGNIDARLLGILLMQPKRLTEAEMDRMVRAATFVQVADWFNAYIVKRHPDKETLRQPWMGSDDPMAARAGWNLTAERVVKRPDGLDIPALLDRIETDLLNAAADVQWTMNATLVEIGIHHPEQRDRAIAIGEALGVYRDYPVSRGCTSPFAPIWINEMVRRQG